MQVQMNRIVNAFRELPEEYQQMIFDKLEGIETAISIEAEVDEEGEGEFDPADDEGLGSRKKIEGNGQSGYWLFQIICGSFCGQSRATQMTGLGSGLPASGVGGGLRPSPGLR